MGAKYIIITVESGDVQIIRHHAPRRNKQGRIPSKLRRRLPRILNLVACILVFALIIAAYVALIAVLVDI